MSARKKSVPEEDLQEEVSVRSSSAKNQNGNTSYLIALGVMLILFAGTVVILISSPQGKKILGRAPDTNAPVANVNVPVAETNTNVNTPPPGPVLNDMGLPEGGQVELVNAMDESNTSIADQKVVWRSASGDVTLVEHASDLLPALKAGSSALVIVARPSGSTRTIFAFGCSGGCDAPGATQPIAFDPALRAFIPLINTPNHYITSAQLSPNQRRMWYTGPSSEAEQRELWVYDFVNDRQTSAIRLPAGESLTEFEVELGPRAVHVTWTDPTMLEYKVYRGGGTVPSFERPRTEIATRTVSVPQ